MGYGTLRPKNLISSLLGQTPVKAKSLAISNPHDFRQVSKFDLRHEAMIHVSPRPSGLTNHRRRHRPGNVPSRALAEAWKR